MRVRRDVVVPIAAPVQAPRVDPAVASDVRPIEGPSVPVPSKFTSSEPLHRGVLNPIELRAAAPSSPSGAAYCEKVLKLIEAKVAAGQKCTVAFDLDNTAFDTRTRTLFVLQKFDAENGTRHFEKLPLDMVGRDGAETATKLGLHPDAVAKVSAFWDREFWDGKNFARDVAVPEVREFAWRALKAGADVVYLTGRIEDLRKPSVEELGREGFPNFDNVVLKPGLDVRTHTFKADWLTTLEKSGTFLGWYMSDSGREVDGMLDRNAKLPLVRVDHPLGREGKPRTDVPVLAVRVGT